MAYLRLSPSNIDKINEKLVAIDDRIIINKFRKVILIDGFKEEMLKTSSIEEVRESLLEEGIHNDQGVKHGYIREYSVLVGELLEVSGVTPAILAAALRLPIGKVEKILQGYDYNPDLREVAIIADLIGLSCGELIDVCYTRRKGRPFGLFLNNTGITAKARVWIDNFMTGKRLHWWTELRGYVYEKNKGKNK